MDRLGKDLLAVIDATGAERCRLCGISIGGMTALWAAVHAPHRVRRVILANTAARIGDAGSGPSGSRPRGPTAWACWPTPPMVRWFTGFPARAHLTSWHTCARRSRTTVDGYAGCCAALRDADLRPLAGAGRLSDADRDRPA